ncbi:hypothetical protein [Lysobacter claricitrinus]|uniref:hypothetical protein n=1 Tax=Lysobacter claricitrinus TaxID=3367728 RepID=UPI0037DACFAE
MSAKTPAVFALFALALAGPVAAREPSPLTRCWKSTFTRQLSGPVREQPRLTSSHRDFIALHDGNFRWEGAPVEAAADLSYVYCFRQFDDDGGVLFANGRPIAMTRKAGGQTVESGAESTTLRDGDTMETLYTRMSGANGASTAIEVLHDGQDNTTRLTLLSTKGRDANLVVLTAPAVTTEVPADGG